MLNATLAILALSLSVAEDSERKGFSFKDTAGEHLDVLLDGKVVARYMYAYDTSDKDRLHVTYKPYLHVFDAEGKAPITKGPGGQYTHHRGIFVGWSKLTCDGKGYDRWHMKGGEQVHQKFSKQEATANGAVFTSVIHWNDNEKSPIVEEARTFTFHSPPSGAYVLVDLTTVIKAPAGDLVLGGDPEHAGIQYRPANEVDRKAATYVFPGENADPRKDLDYPWVGQTYTLNARRYSVVIMNHPDNPKGTKFSAYRDYGRFGAFPVEKIAKGASRTFKYRFLVGEGEMFPVKLIQSTSNAFTGASDPAPKVRVVGGDSKSKKKSKKNKK